MTTVSEKNVGKIHVFSSETQYNSNKSKMANNDIAMVKLNLIDQLKGNSSPVLTPICDWERMKTLNGGTDPRQGTSASSGIKAAMSWNYFPVFTVNNTSVRGIVLKDSIANYDGVIFECTDDSCNYAFYKYMTLQNYIKAMSMGGYFNMSENSSNYFYIYPMECTGTFAVKSTFNYLYGGSENAGFIEIYGVTYTN